MNYFKHQFEQLNASEIFPKGFAFIRRSKALEYVIVGDLLRLIFVCIVSLTDGPLR